MTNILLINSSPLGGHSTSRRLALDLADRLDRGAGRIVHRDVAAEPIPHLDAETLQGFMNPDPVSPVAGAALSGRLIEELRQADVIIIATPMHNFSIPSTLKAWIDHICRAGETFRYTEDGPVGLLGGKQAYIVAAKGGRYSDTGLAAMDFAVPYLKTVLRFIGIDSVHVIEAEGLALGPQATADAIDTAKQKIVALAA